MTTRLIKPLRHGDALPTKKLRDAEEACRHRQHEVPSMQVFSPGVWEHVCPGCGRRVEFTVGTVSL